MDPKTLPRPTFHSSHLPALPPHLLRDLRAEPSYAFETIAKAAVAVHGPAAQQWVASKQRVGYSQDQLARSAVRANANLARMEGAALGVGGFLTAVPDVVAMAWILARDVIFVAAAYGHDPTDPRRAAEMLVIGEIYDSIEAAQAGLDKQGERLAVALARSQADKIMSGSERSLSGRLARYAAKRTVKRFGGRMVPGLGAVLGAIDNAKSAKRVGQRAIEFYRPRPA